MERTLETEEEAMKVEKNVTVDNESPKYFEYIEKNLAVWLENNGYVQAGLTIQDLAKMLDTNRTYLIAYIKEKYKMSFCEWITGLRVEYAKNLLMEHPEISVQKLTESSGFLSRSYFIKSFTLQEGCTPARWKKRQMES